MADLDALREFFAAHALDGRAMPRFVSHDFTRRAQVNAILGCCDTVRNLGTLNDAQLRCLGAIRDTARRLLKSLSQEEAG
jgi:hypothetical protein